MLWLLMLWSLLLQALVFTLVRHPAWEEEGLTPCISFWSPAVTHWHHWGPDPQLPLLLSIVELWCQVLDRTFFRHIPNDTTGIAGLLPPQVRISGMSKLFLVSVICTTTLVEMPTLPLAGVASATCPYRAAKKKKKAGKWFSMQCNSSQFVTPPILWWEYYQQGFWLHSPFPSGYPTWYLTSWPALLGLYWNF